MKVIKKIKSFYEWYINFIRNHPLLSLFSAFIKGMIVGGMFYKNVGRFPQRTPNMRNIIFFTDIVSAYTETLRKY